MVQSNVSIKDNNKDNKKVKKVLNYNKQGLKIMPVSDEKEVMVEISETIDKEKLSHWFKDHPDANVGVVVGEESNISVVEIPGKNINDWNDLLDGSVRIFGPEDEIYCFYEFNEKLDNMANDKNNLNVKIYYSDEIIFLPPTEGYKMGIFRKLTRDNLKKIPQKLIEELNKANSSEKEKIMNELKNIKDYYPTKIAKLILKIEKANGSLWKYNNNRGKLYNYQSDKGFWKINEDRYLLKVIRKYLAEIKIKWDRRSKGKEILDTIKNILLDEKAEELFWLDNEPNRKIINVKNGMIEWGSGNLISHSPKFYSLFQLPVKYDKKAKCSKWKESLKQWIPDSESRKFIQEYIGYCLIPDNSQQLAIILYGTGSNGKGTFLKVINQLFGPNNVSNISMHRFSGSSGRFETKNIQDKLVNICGDIDPNFIQKTSKLKNIIHGDSIRGEYKHGKSFDFIPVTRMIFSANEIPKARDKSEGWYRSFAIVEFPNHFSKEDENFDPYLSDKLMGELSGILNWAIEGLKRLKARGYFDIPQKINDAKEEYKFNNDHIKAFLDEKTEPQKSEYILRKKLYKEYKRYCSTNNFKPQTKQKLGEVVKNSGYSSETKYLDGDSKGCYVGLKLKDYV